MQIFSELARTVEERWLRAGYDERAFADIAARALSDVSPATHVAWREIVDHAVASPALVRQEREPGAESTIALAWGRRFFVQAVFWIDDIASFHHHLFAGAWQVLCGSAVHVECDFATRRRVNAHLALGDLAQRSIEVLRRGDVRAIVPGPRFIHSICHVERPSVSIVVKSLPVAEGMPGLEYLRPHLAWDPQFRDDRVLATQRGLAIVRRTAPGEYVAAAARACAAADLHTAFLVLKQAYPVVERQAFEDIAVAARRTHGAAIDLVTASFEDAGREAYFNTRREVMHDPEHRFFMGGLLHAPDRQTLRALVAARHPGGDPEARIAAWLEEVSGPDGLGIELDDGLRAILRLLLAGHRYPGIRAELEKQFDDEDLAAHDDELRETCATFTGSPILRALFA